MSNVLYAQESCARLLMESNTFGSYNRVINLNVRLILLNLLDTEYWSHQSRLET